MTCKLALMGAPLQHHAATRAARELVKRLKDKRVLLLDVRPKDEFAQGHLPGALNIPLPQLGKQLSKLLKWAQIVAYWRGPYCVLSFEAVAALRAKGYDARRLDDDFPEWKAAGLPVRSASSG